MGFRDRLQTSLAAIYSLALAASCASAPRNKAVDTTSFGPRRPAEVAAVAGTGTLGATVPLTLLAAPRPGSVVAFFPIALERAWRVMPEVYKFVDLRINAIDSAAFAVGDSFTVHGKLDAYPLRDLIDCGTPAAGRGSDSVDVTMFVTSRLEVVQPPIIAVMNTVQAVEHPASGPPIPCRSLSVIEQTLIAVLRRQLVP